MRNTPFTAVTRGTMAFIYESQCDTGYPPTNWILGHVLELTGQVITRPDVTHKPVRRHTMSVWYQFCQAVQPRYLLIHDH